MENITGKVLMGAFLIILGMALFFEQIGFTFWGFNIWSLWPLLLVILGLSALSKRHFIGASILIFLGIAFLVSNYFAFSIFSFWPLIIVVIGIVTLLRPSKTWNNVSGSVSEDKLNDNVMFWGIDKRIKSDKFSGGTVSATFGGYQIDLSEAKIVDGSTLTLNAMFGGGELIVPRDTKVVVNGTGFFGGWENKTNPGSGPTLKIDGYAMFGGVEIKN